MDIVESDDSSEDECYSTADDGPTHPQRQSTVGVGIRRSMYSRIYADVRYQIPDIDLQFLEDEDDIERCQGDETSEEGIDCKEARENLVKKNSQSVGDDLDSPVQFELPLENDLGTSDLKTEGRAGTSDPNTELEKKDESPNFEPKSLTGNVPNVVKHENNEKFKDVASDTISQESISISTVFEPEIYKTVNDNANDTSSSINKAVQDTMSSDLKNIGMSVNTVRELSKIEYSSETGSLVLVLKDDIEDMRLDKALNDIECNSHIDSVSRTRNRFGLDEIFESDTNDETESNLLSKLSVFSSNEQEIESATDMLLGQISMPTTSSKTDETESPVKYLTGSSNATSLQSLAKTTKQPVLCDKENNQTIFLDLRKNIETCGLTETKSTVSKSEENSLSSSDEEDWNEIRKVYKSHTKMNILPANVAKMHEVIKYQEGEYTLFEDKTSHSIVDKKVANQISKSPTKNKNDSEIGLSFDIQPMITKIESWHSSHTCVDSRHQEESLFEEDAEPMQFNSDTTFEENILMNENRILATSSQIVDNCNGEILSSSNRTPQENKEIENNSSLLKLEKSNKCTISPGIENTIAPLITYKEKQGKIMEHSILHYEQSDNVNAKQDYYSNNVSCQIEDKLPEKVHVNGNLLLIKGDIRPYKESFTCSKQDSSKNVNDEHMFQIPCENACLKSATLTKSQPYWVMDEMDVETFSNIEEREEITSLETMEKQSSSGDGIETPLNDKRLTTNYSLKNSYLSNEKDFASHVINDSRDMLIDGNTHIKWKITDDDLTVKKTINSDHRTELPCEIELNVFSKTKTSDDRNEQSCKEAQNTNHIALRGLLPIPNTQFTETREMDALRFEYTDDKLYHCQEDLFQVSGEETPFLHNEVKKQDNNKETTGEEFRPRTTLLNSRADDNENFDYIINDRHFESEKISSLDNNNENKTNMKNKRKSKKKSRKSLEEIQSKEFIENGQRQNMKNKINESSNKNGLNASIAVEIQETKQKQKTSFLKDNEKAKIKDKIQHLQSKYGAANIIFDEDVSFDQPFESLPSSSNGLSKLLLQARLESPGVCCKAPIKNNSSFKERSDAYIGLCTFFLSLLQDSKYKVSQNLKVPFNVIALKQACIDSKLHLFIGVIENEVSQESHQVLKRGKSVRVKKSFFQIVSQYLNKTDLEVVLSDLMMFDTTDAYGTAREKICHGSRKLSSLVSVCQDDVAVTRIFSLRPSIMWNKTRQQTDAISPQVLWLPGTDKKNENTVVLIDNISSMLPKTIAAFMKMIREVSLDICGQRIAYVANADGVDKAYFVVALRGPNATTVQAGKTFTGDSPGLASVKSNYMPLDLSSNSDAHKTVTVTGPEGLMPFTANIIEPLITYTIGRGRGDREVVRWFGPRINNISDLQLVTDDNNNLRNSKSRLPLVSSESFDVLAEPFTTSMLLSICVDRVILSLSSLVPSVYLAASITMAASRGLNTLSMGKAIVTKEDFAGLGFKVQNFGVNINGSKTRTDCSKTSYSVCILVLEGENAHYKAMGITRMLFKQLNSQLPQDTSAKDVLQQKTNGLIRYEHKHDKTDIDDFFAISAINRSIVKILEKMTMPYLSHNDTELMGKIPFMQNAVAFESPCICAVVLFGIPMLELFAEILDILFHDCVNDPQCNSSQTAAENVYMYQGRRSAEIIGVKHLRGLPKHMAHVCSQYVVGSPNWATSVNNLQQAPVVIIILRLLRSNPDVIQKCENVKKYLKKRMQRRELKCDIDAPFDAYAFVDLDTVLRIMLTMFDVNELQPDSCSSWFKDTQWPVYLPYDHPLLQKLDPFLGLFQNVNKQDTFRTANDIKRNNQEQRHIMIISPLSINIPAALLLGNQPSFSFMKFLVDTNYPKYIAKVLSIMGRDRFKVVALAYPAGLSPVFDNEPTMCVVVQRHNAVHRLNQWLPELTSELRNKHVLEVSPTARHAYEAISWHFQRTASGGVFDDSPLSTAEKLTFREDDVFASRHYRKIEWTSNAVKKRRFASAISDTKKSSAIKAPCNSAIDSCCIMPEVIVIVITSVLLRGRFLGETLSENAKYLGLWEKLSSACFRTIGARMLALNRDETNHLLNELHLPDKEHHLMMDRLASSNGPLFALALLRDFALSNFWSIVTRTLNDKEAQSIKENALIPTTKEQVEVLLSSLFENLAPNSEVEIRKVK